MDMTTQPLTRGGGSDCWLAARALETRGGLAKEQERASSRRSFGQDELSQRRDAQPILFVAVLEDDLSPAGHQPVGWDTQWRKRCHIVGVSESPVTTWRATRLMFSLRIHQAEVILIIS